MGFIDFITLKYGAFWGTTMLVIAAITIIAATIATYGLILLLIPAAVLAALLINFIEYMVEKEVRGRKW